MIAKFATQKTLLLATFGALASVATASGAQELGRVISSTPVIAQVAVPRQVCSQQQVQVQGQKSGAGTLMGAIAGGAIGNQFGGGEGRAVATLLGIVGGAMVGDRVEGSAPTQTQNVQSCTTQTFYENRTTAYNVVYEFNGKQYSVQMPQDPGPTVRLQVTPMAAPSSPQSGFTSQVQSEAAPVYVQPAPAPVYVQPAQVVTQVIQPVAPVVYVRPYYPPVGVNLNLGWSNWNGHRHHGHGHGHWR
jgi:uncharacterized protein YcfJ